MLDFTERGTDLESTLATFDKPVSATDLKNSQDVPSWVAIRTRLANQQLQASLISAVHLVAQMKVTSHATHSALSQLMDTALQHGQLSDIALDQRTRYKHPLPDVLKPHPEAVR